MSKWPLPVSFSIAATPANMLATKIGTRWVVVIGSLFVTVGFSLCTIAHQIEVLYVTFGCMVGTFQSIQLNVWVIFNQIVIIMAYNQHVSIVSA